jgi:hypothetical protein
MAEHGAAIRFCNVNFGSNVVLGLINTFDVGQCGTNIFIYREQHFGNWGQISKRRAEVRRGRYANQEASMISEIANDRIFGLVLATIIASVLILNALAY